MFKQKSRRSLGFLIAVAVISLGCLNVRAQDTRTRRIEPQKDGQVPPEPQNLDVIKVDSNLVSVPVIVSDREGRYVPNLTAQQFKLFDNTNEQNITYFDAAEEPVNVALLLDTSRSTEGAIDDIRKAAKNFLKELRPQDRAMVISFDYAIHHLSELTNDRKVLEKAIGQAKVGEYVGTTLNDAVVEVTGKDFRTVTGRKAIILLSDGQDHGSVLPTDELLNEESESDTMVYSIYYAPEFRRDRDRPFRRGGPDRFPGRGGGGGIFRRGGRFAHAPQRPGQRGQMRNRHQDGAEILRELSEITSGRFYQSDTTDLKETFGLIAEELRHQYRLGFYPGELQKDGTVHQLRVKVDAADVAVRARQQYRAQ